MSGPAPTRKLRREPERPSEKVDVLAACELRLSSTFLSRRLEDESRRRDDDGLKRTKRNQ